MTEKIIMPLAYARTEKTKWGTPTMDELHARLVIVEHAQERDRQRWESVIRTTESNAAATESMRETIGEHIKAQEKSEERRDREYRLLKIILISMLANAAVGKDLQSWFVDTLHIPQMADSIMVLVSILLFAWVLDKYGFGGK